MPEQNQSNGLRFALLLTVFCALGPFTLDMYLSAFPQIVHSFGTTVTLVQTSLTAGLVGLAFGQVIIGTLSDSHGRRKPLLFSMVVYTISSLGCALAPNMETFLTLRFVQGFAGSAGLVIARAMVRDRMSGLSLTKFFALLSTVNSAAPLLSPLVGGLLVGFVAWRGVFLFTSLVGLYLTLVTVWKVKETLPVERRVRNHVGAILQNYRELLTHRTFVGYALASGVLYAGMFGYIAASPFVFQNLYGLSPQAFSVVFALNGVGIMVGPKSFDSLRGEFQNGESSNLEWH
jgi:DHA1 family bicyclomycin/chloramphenicol resistance-like MFS transporter